MIIMRAESGGDIDNSAMFPSEALLKSFGVQWKLPIYQSYSASFRIKWSGEVKELLCEVNKQSALEPLEFCEILSALLCICGDFKRRSTKHFTPNSRVNLRRFLRNFSVFHFNMVFNTPFDILAASGLRFLNPQSSHSNDQWTSEMYPLESGKLRFGLSIRKIRWMLSERMTGYKKNWLWYNGWWDVLMRQKKSSFPNH